MECFVFLEKKKGIKILKKPCSSRGVCEHEGVLGGTAALRVPCGPGGLQFFCPFSDTPEVSSRLWQACPGDGVCGDGEDTFRAEGLDFQPGLLVWRCMLLWREPLPSDWFSRIKDRLPEVLVDHAHLERKAATTALNLEKYQELFPVVRELNAIAIEELQHFEQVLEILRQRGISFGQPRRSPWISAMMAAVRKGRREQVIDHLLVCSLIEGRSCEKFQILAASVRGQDAELADFYAGLVESEGNHYATYLLMARHIDEEETRRRMEDFLELDARLIVQPHGLPILH